MGSVHAVWLVSIYFWGGRMPELWFSDESFGETLLEIEAQRARIAAGPGYVRMWMGDPSGISCLCASDGWERWTCVLKMLAQMASTSPS